MTGQKQVKKLQSTMRRPGSGKDLEMIYFLPVFATLPHKTVDRVLKHSSVVTLPQRTMLFYPGDSIQSFDTVLEGYVKIYQLSSDGDEAVICILSKNKSVPFSLLPSAGMYNSEYAETIGTTRLLRIDITHLFGCLRENADISFSVLKIFAQQMSDLGDEVLYMKSMTLSRRLARFVHELCKEKTGSEIVVLPYEKTILANLLGVTRESLSRAFLSLKQIDVTTKSNTIFIPDIEALHGYYALNVPKTG